MSKRIWGKIMIVCENTRVNTTVRQKSVKYNVIKQNGKLSKPPQDQTNMQYCVMRDDLIIELSRLKRMVVAGSRRWYGGT